MIGPSPNVILKGQLSAMKAQVCGLGRCFEGEGFYKGSGYSTELSLATSLTFADLLSRNLLSCIKTLASRCVNST